MIVLNPAIESVPASAQMAARPASLEGLTVAFFGNAKPMADVFLQELGSAFEERYRIEAIYDGKPDPSRVVAPAQLRSVAARAHAIVTGVGD